MNTYVITIETKSYDCSFEFDDVQEALDEYKQQVQELVSEDKATIELGIYSSLTGIYKEIRLCKLESKEW